MDMWKSGLFFFFLESFNDKFNFGFDFNCINFVTCYTLKFVLMLP